LSILHVVEATTAGVGRHVLDLSSQMHRAGLAVTVACPPVRQVARQDTAFVDRLQAAGVPVVPVPMRRNIHPLADLRAYRELLRLIRHGGYNVVHTHSSKAGVLGRLAARRAGVLVSIYTPNAFAFLSAGNRLVAWLYRWIERWLGHNATDALICVSPSELALARQQAIAPPGRLVLIENSIDAATFASPGDTLAAKTRLGLDPSRPVVGFVGRLAPQKGVEELIEAARRVDQAQFVLIGEGELETTLRRAVARHRLKDRVLLAGYRSDVPQLLPALDLFVLPSRYEGLPYTLMEAMAAGRAVIASDVMGNRDLVEPGHTGLLIPPRDPRALARTMIRLLSAPEEREQLGKNALAAAQSRPTPEQTVRQTVDLYLKIFEDRQERQ